MHKAYKDYYWKDGKPYGKEVTDDLAGLTYRIVVDPYYKRFSVEEYEEGRFKRLVYDSALFDFRALKRPEYAAWRREPIDEENSLIRNEEDRLVLIESYLFEGPVCRGCLVATPHGTPVSYHRMHYEKLGDPFNGVILFDANHKPVMKKIYALTPETEEFGELLQEIWSPTE